MPSLVIPALIALGWDFRYAPTLSFYLVAFLFNIVLQIINVFFKPLPAKSSYFA